MYALIIMYIDLDRKKIDLKFMFNQIGALF